MLLCVCDPPCVFFSAGKWLLNSVRTMINGRSDPDGLEEAAGICHSRAGTNVGVYTMQHFIPLHLASAQAQPHSV